MSIEQPGVTDIYLEKYDENISVSKATIHIKNIIFGGLYCEAVGQMKAYSHKSKEYAIVNFFEK